MLEICAIASGSNGNCYYIGNEDNAVLIDAGISRKQIILRMAERGLDVSKIKAVFISHEHSDHIRGAYVLGKRLNIPVYLTAKTYNSAYKNMRPLYPRFFTLNVPVQLNGFTIFPFSKNHDAAEPCSFRIKYENIHIGVFTDIGNPCENVTTQLGICNGVFMETNYDEKMLWEGKYPWHLKNRIASENGHLSNRQAFQLLDKHAGNNLKCVFLSHLSQENNTPEIAYKTIAPLKDRFEIKLTSRTQPGEVYRFETGTNEMEM